MAEEDCEYLVYHGAVAKGDPDISGIGVIMAFVTSAYITFTVITAAYIGGYVDGPLLNEIDRKIFHIRPYHQGYDSSRAYKCIRHVVVVLSDQQIVTGIAIMAAGFRGLQSKDISVYHFQIVLYLAWMSSSVHLSAVTLLGSFLRERRGILIWRFFGMIVLMVMLIVGLVPTISNDWGIFHWTGMLDDRTGWAIPAHCFWGELWGDGVGPDAPLGFVILALSYLCKMGALFDTTSSGYRRLFRNPLEKSILNGIKYPAMRYARDRNSWAWLCIYRLVLGLGLPSLATIEVASSFAASLWLSLTSLIYGTMQIFVPREQMLPMTGSSESSWGFGQLVPLILLVQPVGVVFEHLWTKEEIDLEHQDQREISNASSSSRFATVPAIDASTALPSLLEILTSKSTINLNNRESGIWRLLYSSKLFAAMVYLVQCAIAGICAAVFYFDMLSIGTGRSDNWAMILVAVAGFLVLGFLITVVLAPFSVTGRHSVHCKRESSSTHEGERTLELLRVASSKPIAIHPE